MADIQDCIVRFIVQQALINRPALYQIPEMTDVAHNGGSRINGRLQQVLTKMVKGHDPEADGAAIVKEELATITAAKKSGGGGGGTEGKGAGGSPKRKKAKDDDGSDSSGSPKKGKANKASPAKGKAGSKVKSEAVANVEEVKSEEGEAEADEKPQVSEDDE
jgi:hypothetical protein